MLDRPTIIDALRADLETADFVRAAWLGGSDATGRTDEWSDIDLAVIVEDERVEETFALIDATLARLSSIAIRLRVPQPTWHGFDQVFYRLSEAEPTLMVDVSVMKLSHGDRFLERERHGEAVVLFDHDGLVVAPPLDRAALAARMRARLADLRLRFPLFQNLVTKAVWRDSLVEAASMYHGATLRPLIDVLRMLHCPERFDFGPRYLQDDLPAELYARLEPMAMPANGAEILERQAEAEKIFAETVRTIDANGTIDAFERGMTTV